MPRRPETKGRALATNGSREMLEEGVPSRTIRVVGSGLPGGEKPRGAADLEARLERLDEDSVFDPSDEFVARVPIQYARKHALLGLRPEEGRLPLLVPGIEDYDPIDVVSRYLGMPVRLLIASRERILDAIHRAYEKRGGETEHVIEGLDRGAVLEELEGVSLHDDLLESDHRSPVVRLVNLLLFEAVKHDASDVHIQPYEDALWVRLRIDGVLFDTFSLPRRLHEEVVSRVKVMGHMDIAEKRLAQDGRATVLVGDRVIDLRISSVPASHGERIVVRLLDKSARLYTLEEIGMSRETYTVFRELISVEHGLILVTGPTGSGKTTTLYAALQEINSKERNIITLEDPIEYQLEGISQIQVSHRKGMTFASGLRSVLRQDPDIIMVGEIRDEETAVMAIQSALTGHLVFSTLHTNDAASAVTRLLDLGIEPYLVSSSVVGVMAQRLVRRICRECVEPAEPGEDELSRIGLDPAAARGNVLRGAGCGRCRGTGYSGRLGIFELLVVGDRIRRLIQKRATASEVFDAASRAGMRSLREDGAERVAAGLTTVDEVIRVTLRRSL